MNPEIGAELKWNSEADEYNQWDTLGQDEKDELIAMFISEERCKRCHVTNPEIPVDCGLPGPDCPRFGAPRECSSLCHPEEPCIITESGTCQESMVYYQCKCGHAFSEELGKYGCPNCEGDSGPAELKQTPSISNE